MVMMVVMVVVVIVVVWIDGDNGANIQLRRLGLFLQHQSRIYMKEIKRKVPPEMLRAPFVLPVFGLSE